MKEVFWHKKNLLFIFFSLLFVFSTTNQSAAEEELELLNDEVFVADLQALARNSLHQADDDDDNQEVPPEEKCACPIPKADVDNCTCDEEDDCEDEACALNYVVDEVPHVRTESCVWGPLVPCTCDTTGLDDLPVGWSYVCDVGSSVTCGEYDCLAKAPNGSTTPTGNKCKNA